MLYKGMYVRNPSLLVKETQGKLEIVVESEGLKLNTSLQLQMILKFFNDPKPIETVSLYFDSDVVSFLVENSFIIPFQDREIFANGLLQAASHPLKNPTSLSCLQLLPEDSAVLYGAPFSFTTTPRSPARGIDEVRKFLPGPSSSIPDVAPTLKDLGDLVVLPSENITTAGRRLEIITERIVAQGHLPILLGGDHSVTFFAVKSISSRSGPIGLIQFDAHTDTYYDSRQPEINRRLNHANFVYHLVERNFVSEVLQVGVRDELSFSRPSTYNSCEISSIKAADLEQMTDEEVFSKLDPAASWYISIDVDVLDPSIAPEVTSPIVAGVNFFRLRSLVRYVASNYKLVGLDTVEVCMGSGPYNHAAHYAAILVVDVVNAQRRKITL